MFLPNPGIMAAGATDDGYSAFVTHIETIATHGNIPWGQRINFGVDQVRSYVTTADAFIGSMYGSPLGGYVPNDSGFGAPVRRLVQHSLPNGDLSGADPGRKIYLRLRAPNQSQPSFTGKTVNGYTSSNLDIGQQFLIISCEQIIWWSSGSAWTRNPFTATPKTPYNW